MTESAAARDNKINAREALLSSAEELFTLKGYAAVSTRELAERAGVNLGAIAYHFGSKAELFVETVRRLMRARQQRNLFMLTTGNVNGRDEAALELCLFIDGLLMDICRPEGPDACRLMHREIHGATSQDPELFEPLVSSVVEEFIRPIDARLLALLRVLRPAADESELQFIVQSIIGQCAYYLTHRPFTERLRGIDVTSEEYLLRAGEHVSTFTLRALELGAAEIERAFIGARKWRGENR